MTTPAPKLRILFLCTGNACRSQMAEGWARHFHGERFEVYSAGTAPAGPSRKAVRVMAEAGVDISAHTSKHVDTLLHVPFDYVITVCGHARENCPLFPGGAKHPAPTLLHVGFDDPPALAKGAVTEEEILAPYRRVRDQIRDWIRTLPESLPPRGGRS